MVRTRTASRSRRAPGRARVVPAGRPRVRPSIRHQAAVSRSVGASFPRVASLAHRGRGSDARARAGRMARVWLGRMGTGSCARARARVSPGRPAGESSLVGGSGSVGWVGGWLVWTSRTAGSGRRRETGANAKIFSGAGRHHFAFARAPARPPPRGARARRFPRRCAAAPFPVFPRFGRDGGLGLHPKTQSNRTDAPRQTTKAQRGRHRKSFRGTGTHPAFRAIAAFDRRRTHSPAETGKTSRPQAFFRSKRDATVQTHAEESPSFFLALPPIGSKRAAGGAEEKEKRARRGEEKGAGRGRGELPHVPVARAEGPRPRSAARPPAL